MLETRRAARSQITPFEFRKQLVIVTDQQLTRVHTKRVVPTTVQDRIPKCVQREFGCTRLRARARAGENNGGHGAEKPAAWSPVSSHVG